MGVLRFAIDGIKNYLPVCLNVCRILQLQLPLCIELSHIND
jgi:hypothetical protein